MRAGAPPLAPPVRALGAQPHAPPVFDQGQSQQGKAGLLKHCSALFFGARAASNGRFRFFLNFWSGLGLEAIRALLAIRAIRTYCPARPEAPAHPVARRGDKATARGFEPLWEEPDGF